MTQGGGETAPGGSALSQYATATAWFANLAKQDAARVGEESGSRQDRIWNLETALHRLVLSGATIGDGEAPVHPPGDVLYELALADALRADEIAGFGSEADGLGPRSSCLIACEAARRVLHPVRFPRVFPEGSRFRGRHTN